MRFMIIRKADQDTEAGVMPGEALLEAMAKYNEELIKAGVMLDGMGLHPSSAGARVQFTNGKPVVTDGPFVETRELLAGFTMIQVQSKAEAIEWVKRWPAEDANGNVQLELRRVYEMEDFAPGDAIDHHQQNAARLDAAKLQVNPYLTFNGNCRAAFEYYERVLGGEIEAMMSFAESPSCDQMSADTPDLIMHACMKLGNVLLMGSDAPAGHFERTQGMAVSLSVPDEEEARRVFNALADNGTITMPLEATFWSPAFAMLTDQFGIQWMINCLPAE